MASCDQQHSTAGGVAADQGQNCPCRVSVDSYCPHWVQLMEAGAILSHHILAVPIGWCISLAHLLLMETRTMDARCSCSGVGDMTWLWRPSGLVHVACSSKHANVRSRRRAGGLLARLFPTEAKSGLSGCSAVRSSQDRFFALAQGTHRTGCIFAEHPGIVYSTVKPLGAADADTELGHLGTNILVAASGCN